MEILGIDIGGSGIKAAPVNVLTGQLIAPRERMDTPSPATPESVTEVVGMIVRKFDWAGPVGCAFPARIKHGRALTASNIAKSWKGTSVRKMIESETGCEVHVVNDADAAGLAEMRFGAGKGRRDLVLLLTVGTGIGSALFIDQTLVPNTEFGHLELNGRNAESFASDRTRKRRNLGWKRWARRFQRYLDLIDFLIAPDLIILGGGVSRPQRKELYFDRLKSDAELKTAAFENEAGIIGSALFAAEHFGQSDA